MSNTDAYRRALPSDLRDLVVEAGTKEYDAATTPRNASAQQKPAAVLRAYRVEHVVASVRAAADAGVHVVPQATGHGAAGSIGDDAVLLDTSALNTVQIDAERRVAHVGAGATFGRINAAAYHHGLLALAGTAPSVAVVGYTAQGGVGWLTRPHGLASASLLSVDVIDGEGRIIHAEDGHNDDLLWVFRGGGGAGIATSMELRLYPVDELVAGYALWTVDRAADVLPAWGNALTTFDPALSTAIALLKAPNVPTVPEELHGHRVVHLSAATVDGSRAAQTLERLLRTLPEPAINTFGPADAARLSQIHLDPPAPVPAVGDGRWLTADAAGFVEEILTATGTDDDGPLAEVELRHVAVVPSHVSGALTSVPGDLLLHATGPAPDADARRAVLDALGQVMTAARPVDTGLSASAFRDGRPASADTLPADISSRANRIRTSTDPNALIVPSRSTATD